MEDILSRIEHTVLGPETSPADVRSVLDDAIEYGLRVCVPPSYVSLAAEYAPQVAISTVIGFPHGNTTTETKAQEARIAVEDGADELDMVCHVGRLKAGDGEDVKRDIEEVVAATSKPVKVIIETPLLDDMEKHRACKLAADAGASYVKTATGFSDGGATVADVALMSDYAPVKASGGVGSWESAEAMFDAGAARIGTSSGDVIAAEYLETNEA
ncbi:MAG: deoxyribose-phosphate aldolase [archaeon]